MTHLRQVVGNITSRLQHPRRDLTTLDEELYILAQIDAGLGPEDRALITQARQEIMGNPVGWARELANETDETNREVMVAVLLYLDRQSWPRGDNDLGHACWLCVHELIKLGEIQDVETWCAGMYC